MNTSIRHWLNRLSVDSPLQRQQANMFQLVLLAWIVLGFVGTMATVLIPRGQVPATLPPQAIVGLILLSIGGLLLWIVPLVALVILRRGRLAAAVNTAGFGLLAAHSMAAFVLGLYDPSVVVVFELPIALLGLLAGRRVLWTAVGLTIAVVVLVGALQSITPPLAGFFYQFAQGSVTESISLGQVVGFFVVVTILIALLLDRFGSALREALASSLEREHELQAIRDSLETSVAERTAELQAALGDVQTQAAAQQLLLAEIEQQRATIQDLSVPVIPISDQTLVMPLVGALDSTRLRQAQEQSLRALERSTARTLVLDITGVPIVDTQVAQGLLMMIRSARLIGAEATLVGIRPEVAQTMVGLGIDLRDVRTFSDLQSALDQVVA